MRGGAARTCAIRLSHPEDTPRVVGEARSLGARWRKFAKRRGGRCDHLLLLTNGLAAATVSDQKTFGGFWLGYGLKTVIELSADLF